MDFLSPITSPMKIIQFQRVAQSWNRALQNKQNNPVFIINAQTILLTAVKFPTHFALTVLFIPRSLASLISSKLALIIVGELICDSEWNISDNNFIRFSRLNLWTADDRLLINFLIIIKWMSGLWFKFQAVGVLYLNAEISRGLPLMGVENLPVKCILFKTLCFIF